MYIYNVTLSIDKSIHKEWLAWIHNHIPEVLATGKFTSAKLTQVLVEEDMGGVTYADRLRVVGMQKFTDKVLAFRTELKIVGEFFSNEVNN